MKKYFFFTLTLFLTLVLTGGAFARVTSSKSKPLFSCRLNPETQLHIVRSDIQRDGRDADGGPTFSTFIILQTVSDLDSRIKTTVTLASTEIVNYGGGLIILVNQGRSGYALLHFQQESGKWMGHLDINLFGENYEAINTDGMKKVLCSPIIRHY